MPSDGEAERIAVVHKPAAGGDGSETRRLAMVTTAAHAAPAALGTATLCHAFQVTAFLDQIFHLVTVGNTVDALLDNRAFIQHFGHIMAGCANQFHAALKRTVVWSCADKRRQERMVDVDDLFRIARYKIR